MKYYCLALTLVLGLFFSCRASYKHDQPAVMFYQPGKDTIAVIDSSFLRVIVPYRDKMNLVMNDTLAFSSAPMQKGQPESALGNFVADACYSITLSRINSTGLTAPDFCVLNNGGLRSSLPAGLITKKNVFELMPFENELVIVTLSGTATLELLEFISAKGGVPVSHLKMNLQKEQLQQASIGENKFDISRTYHILTSDYLTYGGDAMTVFAKRDTLAFTGIKVRDAIIDYLQQFYKNNDTVNPVIDGRLSN